MACFFPFKYWQICKDRISKAGKTVRKGLVRIFRYSCFEKNLTTRLEFLTFILKLF